jgi:hypothetical protein
MVKKPFSKLMTVYDISSTVNQSLSNALRPKNIKSCIVVTSLWPFNRDMFIDEDFSTTVAVTDRRLQINESLENSGVSQFKLQFEC